LQSKARRVAFPNGSDRLAHLRADPHDARAVFPSRPTKMPAADRHVPWHRRARLGLNLAALLAASLVLWAIILTPVWHAIR